MTHDKRSAEIELAGRTFELAHDFRPCESPYHAEACCYASGPHTAFHADQYPSYEENEHLARQIVRKRGEHAARMEVLGGIAP